MKRDINLDRVNIYPAESPLITGIDYYAGTGVSLFYRDGKKIAQIDFNSDGSVNKYSVVDGLLSAEDKKELETAAPNDAAKITEVLRRYTRCLPPGFITLG